MSEHEVLEGLAVQLEPADAFTGLLVDVQSYVLGKLVRVDGLWGVPTHVATVDGADGRTAAVVLDGDVERCVIIREDVLGVVDLDLSGEAVELYVNQRQRSIVFEVAPR
ncbi:MAG TPA: hypothetical protein VK501_24800 [Baekduia sp.]|uniref:hypothetical protein n=1 Tax=Baekduia sp. TaxID=2600305 RepID=UPI002B849D93|nr:hypothetical protein [Baekduia sp.]HMJ37148.1 hypothetical protein [Baekduia sp.]